METATATTTSGEVLSPARQQRVPLKLKTSITGLELPPVQYLVPTTFARSQLSTLVNRLLQQTLELHQTIPFDFIVDGSLLRESLEVWLDNNGRTVEEGIELEYVKSTLPPRWAGTFKHDDWVVSIDASRTSIFLSASYDSCIRVFSYQNPQEPLMTHKVPALAQSSPQCLVDARWIAADTAATAGLDGAVRVWSMPEVIFDPSTATDEAHGVSSSQSPRQVWLGTHHPLLSSKAATAFVSTKSTSSSFNMSPVGLTSLDISADSASLLTASRDGSIAYWKLDEVLKQAVGNVAAGDGGDADNDDEDAQHKRRKGANGKKHISSTAALSSKRPSALFWHSPPVASNTVGSTSGPSYVCATNARVSQAVFDPQDPTKAVSGGYDGKLIEWDLFAATKDGNPKVSVRQTSDSRAILCVACPKQTASTGSARVVTGQMDRSICLWDLSSSSSSARVVMSNAHAGPVYSASCHPNEAHLFATAGGDGSVKIWDARSHKRALFALRTPSIRGKSSASGDQKLLACEWDRFTAEDEASAEGKGHVLLAGGEDCTVNVFRQS